MSVRTSLPSTIIRFGGPDVPSSVTQADMPESNGSVRRELADPFDAAAYRIYSEDFARSELFRFAYRAKSVSVGSSVVYVFHSVVAGAQNRLDLDGCQLSQLRASRRIAAVHRKPENGARTDAERLPVSYRTRSGFGNARSVGVKADGTSLMSGHGEVPGVLLSSEVSVPHLADQEVDFSVGDRTIRVKVTFGSHCWTQGVDDLDPLPDPAIIDEHGKIRAFSAKRYQLSRQLPGMFRKLLSNRVYDTGKFEHLGLYVAAGTLPSAYTAFFSLRRSTGLPGPDIHIQVRSAYVKSRPVCTRGIDIAKLLGSARPQLHCNDDAAVLPEGRPDATA